MMGHNPSLPNASTAKLAIQTVGLCKDYGALRAWIHWTSKYPKASSSGSSPTAQARPPPSTC